MNIWKISIKNTKAKLSYTLLSIFTLALSVSLLLSISLIKNTFEHQIENNLGGVDLVIGAKGSPLQLILSSILHLDNPTGNISYKDAKKISTNPLIKKAVPISYGDNYKGYRIIGTDVKNFMSLYKAKIKKGRISNKNFEVVIGSAIANKLQLDIGDTFFSSHGLIENDIDIHDGLYTVLGILKPTQKVVDRVIICPLPTIWETHKHSEEHDEKEHKKHDNKEHHENEYDFDEHQHLKEQVVNNEVNREITAMLVSFKNLSALLTLPRKINNDTKMQAALPKYELKKLYKITGIGLQTITWIAYLILFISGLTIFISFYKMIKERAFDLALLRTYGASNLQLIKMVIYEGLLITFSAVIIAIVITKIGLLVFTKLLETGYQQLILKSLPLNEIIEIIGMVLAMIILAIILAIIPIIKMNISTILSNEK